MVKGFKITNIDFHQPVSLPAGTYTYSCKARPVWSSITFRVGLTDYVISNLSPGVYQKGIKYTFTVESEQTNFYPSRTVGDEIFEPQLEEGTKATTAGPNILDEPEALSRAGIQITEAMVEIYATKEGVDTSISIEAGKITQNVEDVSGRVSTIEQTTESIRHEVMDEAGKVSTIEQTAESIRHEVMDEDGKVSTIEQTVDGMSSTVTKAGQVVSQILQEDGTVKIKAEYIELEGSETADGNFVVNVDGTIKAKGAEIEGKIMSSSDGNRVIIDPDDKSVKLIDSNDETLSNIGFKEVTEGSQTFNQPYIEQLSPSAYSFTPKSFFRPSYIELTNVTGFKNTSFVFDAKNSQIILGLSGSSPGTLKINIKNLPTSDSGLSAGDLYRDSSGYLKIV